MHICRRHLRLLALTAAFAAAPFGAAYAQTVEAALERFKSLVEDQGIKVEWASADISGDDAVLVGVSVGTDDGMLPLGNVQFENVSRVDDGYRVELIAMDDVFFDDGEGNRFTMNGMSMGSVLLPDDAVRDSYGGTFFYENAEVASISVSVEDTEVFTLSDAHTTISRPESGAMDFTAVVEEFTVDLSLAEDSEQYPIIQALGYETLSGYIESEGSWNQTSGRLELTRNEISIVDAGTIGFTVDLGGYTPAFIAALRELQQQMAANPDGDTSAQGFAVLGLMQQLIFHSAEIAFTDDSLTNKVLELVAQMQGMGKADIANMAKAAVPFALAQLGNPDFTTQTTQAVSKFLDDPQALRIRAAPAEPRPFALLMAEGMSTPQALINTLNVRVTAND